MSWMLNSAVLQSYYPHTSIGIECLRCMLDSTSFLSLSDVHAVKQVCWGGTHLRLNRS